MRISEIFNLEKTQYELDFVDIDTEQDIPLFVDPYLLGNREDSFSISCSRTIRNFYESFVSLLRAGEKTKARQLFDNLHEPNETCLGMSDGKPTGRGIGREQATLIFESIAESRAIKTGLVEHIEDFRLFIEGIDKDKISDMTTNIIRYHLIHYTQKQCNLWKIPLTKDVPSGFCWMRDKRCWDSFYTEMLIVDNRKILLIPKSIVSFSKRYTSQQYYQHYVLNYLQQEHLRMDTVLVQKRYKKKKLVKRFVTKKSLKEYQETQYSKDFLVTFSNSHPEIFKEFKAKASINMDSISNETLTNEPLTDVINYLIQKLENMKSGNDYATQYHRLVLGILELIFYPVLISPEIENEIHDGRKRIDITFDNAAQNGFFQRLHAINKINCQFIIVECKNYSRDIKNPELDQITGRFSPNRGRFGLIVCRDIDDMDTFIKRCSDTYKDDRGVVIPLIDRDLISLLILIRNREDRPEEKLLSDRYRRICLS